MPESGRPSIRSGSRPSLVSTCAPISERGAATRSIGRELSESSPVSSKRRPSWPARRPGSSRASVPAFPQSIGASGSRSPESPRPRTCSTSGSSSSTETPSDRTAAIVDSVSSERPNPRTIVAPSHTAPTSSARCEIDLSPGTRSAPRRLAAGATSINLRRDRRGRAALAPTRRPATASLRCRRRRRR